MTLCSTKQLARKPPKAFVTFSFAFTLLSFTSYVVQNGTCDLDILSLKHFSLVTKYGVEEEEKKMEMRMRKAINYFTRL